MILSVYKTLLEDLHIAKAAGYLAEFYFRDHKIHDMATSKSYDNTQCVLVEYCRHEGDSDPDDASILFLIVCYDGKKGCLTSNYGVHADATLMDFAMTLKKQ